MSKLQKIGTDSFFFWKSTPSPHPPSISSGRLAVVWCRPSSTPAACTSRCSTFCPSLPQDPPGGGGRRDDPRKSSKAYRNSLVFEFAIYFSQVQFFFRLKMEFFFSVFLSFSSCHQFAWIFMGSRCPGPTPQNSPHRTARSLCGWNTWPTPGGLDHTLPN